MSSQKDAATSEIASLRAVCRIIESYNLESQYSSEPLKRRIKQLRKQRKDTKATGTAPSPKGKPQGPQQLRGMKRNIPAPKPQSVQHVGNKRFRTDMSLPHASDYIVAAPTASMIQTSHHLPSGHLTSAAQDSPYLISSVRMHSPASGSHYVSGPSTSSATYLMQQSRCEPTGLVMDSSTQRMSPLTKSIALSRPDANTSLGATSSSYLVQRSHYDQEHHHSSRGGRQLTPSATAQYSLASSSVDGAQLNLTADHYDPAASLASDSHVMRLTGDRYGVDDALVSRYIGSSARRYGSSSVLPENYESTGGTPHSVAAAPYGSPSRPLVAPRYGSPGRSLRPNMVESLRTPGYHYRL